MRIIFVRHGHPDYARDCLTELGHVQAAAAARRLAGEGVERIFSSTCGRALETAQHLAELLALPVERCDCMRELHWGGVTGPLPDDGHPWTTVDRMVAAGEPLLDAGWAQGARFGDNRVVQSACHAADGMDALLATLGYVREGLYYRVQPHRERTVAVFSHGGASAAMLSRLFNLPLPFVLGAMGPDYTAVTIAALPDAVGELAAPRFELLNDACHIAGMTAENIYGR